MKKLASCMCDLYRCDAVIYRNDPMALEEEVHFETKKELFKEQLWLRDLLQAVNFYLYFWVCLSLALLANPEEMNGAQRY